MDTIRKFVIKLNNKYLLLSLTGLWCALLQSTFELPLVALFSFAPIMYALCRYRSRRGFVKSFACFFVPYYFYQLAFLLTLHRQINMNRALSLLLLLAAVAALTVWECLVMLAPVCLFTYLRRDKLYDVVTLALLVAGGEWLQENIPLLSFPWSAVWLSVTSKPLLLQPANLIGCRAVTVLVLCVSGLAALAVKCKKRLPALVSLAAVLAAWVGYGYFSMSRFERICESSPQITAAVAQDEVEGSKKQSCSAWDCARSYKRIITAAEITSADIVVLPETAVPMGYDENADEFRLVSSLARGCGATVINGCFYRRGDDEYNALYAVDSSGSVSEPYFKQVLVPFGEKIPLAFLFGASTLCECSDETNTRPLDTALGSIGCVICIESVYPEIVRKQAAQGAQILCVCSNDSWFGGSYARSMHFRHSIMRAAENGRYLLRSGNCGISAIIKPTGEVQSVRTQTSKGVLTGQVHLIDDRTLYSAFKDLFTVLPALLTALAVMRMYTSKKR